MRDLVGSDAIGRGSADAEEDRRLDRDLAAATLLNGQASSASTERGIVFVVFGVGLRGAQRQR